MSDAMVGFWIRKDRNVQVRCLGKGALINDPELLTVCFKNGHTKYMHSGELLREFVSLDDFQAEKTEGSEWVSRKSAYLGEVGDVFVIRNIDLKEGRVIYARKGQKCNARFQVPIGRFDLKFKRNHGEQT